MATQREQDVNANAINASQRGEVAGPGQYILPRARERYKRSLWFIDMTNPSNRIEIQNVPLQLSFDSATSLIAVASPGRNNPFYFYTGAEDTLEFELSWYSKEENREDVIRKCKWLEGMAKNDGYSKGIRHLGLEWTSGDGGFPTSGNLFQFSTWLVAGAPFDAKLFHGSRNMMPCLAIQRVKLVKTTAINNPTSKIIDYRF